MGFEPKSLARWKNQRFTIVKPRNHLWSWWTDSNPRPTDYKSVALPTELHQHTYLLKKERLSIWTGLQVYCRLISDSIHIVSPLYLLAALTVAAGRRCHAYLFSFWTHKWQHRFIQFFLLSPTKILERLTRIELASSAWRAGMLPLHHRRISPAVIWISRLGSGWKKRKRKQNASSKTIKQAAHLLQVWPLEAGQEKVV